MCAPEQTLGVALFLAAFKTNALTVSVDLREPWLAHELTKADGYQRLRDQQGQRPEIGLAQDQHSDKHGERHGMEEHEAQDRAFMAVPFGRGRGDDDRLRVDHLAHDAARAVRRGHQHRIDADLLGGHFLEPAEENVRRGVRPRQRHAEPADQRAEKRIGPAAIGERQAERRIASRVARDEADRQHAGDG